MTFFIVVFTYLSASLCIRFSELIFNEYFLSRRKNAEDHLGEKGDLYTSEEILHNLKSFLGVPISLPVHFGPHSNLYIPWAFSLRNFQETWLVRNSLKNNLFPLSQSHQKVLTG